jgi:cobyrinic acid a,c-diamide synthase
LKPRWQVLISAPGSSHGKTVFTLLLLAWARRQGLQPRAFKAGPDFIDPQYLAAVSGQAAPSLDPWFLGAPAMRRHFEAWSAGAGIAVVEGVMGLYDGKRDEPFGAYSSASVARRLDLPVLLVLNARKAGPTLATQVLGLQKADSKLKIAGVILNQAASAKTFEMLAPVIRKLCGVPVLGWMPTLPTLALPERHLGLAAPSELKSWQAMLEGALAHVAPTVDFAGILKALKPYARKPTALKAAPKPKAPFTLAVARDKAFHFYYPESLALLESLGAKLVFFSPLDDVRLPKGAQGLLIGGGFPEIFGQALAANTPMLKHAKQAIGAGLPTWAECGGLMWLAENLVDLEGKEHRLVGALKASTSMTPRLQHFGYTQAKVGAGHAFFPRDLVLRGHEFHHSQWQARGAVTSTWTLEQSGRASRPEGWRLPQGLATYFHSYLPASPLAARRFADVCRNHQGIV